MKPSVSNEEAALLSDGAALASPAVSSSAFPGAGDNVCFMELFMSPVNLSAWRHALTHCLCLESWMGTH